jgi:hypothetical protein
MPSTNRSYRLTKACAVWPTLLAFIVMSQPAGLSGDPLAAGVDILHRGLVHVEEAAVDVPERDVAEATEVVAAALVGVPPGRRLPLP